MKKILLILLISAIFACKTEKQDQPKPDRLSADLPADRHGKADPAGGEEIIQDSELVKLNLNQANRLAQLPLHCMQQEFPYKLGQTLGNENELGAPKELHPAFYGCFDWHSSVHGHWMLIRLLKTFPELNERDLIEQKLKENISAENIQSELEYFKRSTEKSYERTYGWAWLLKLAEELNTWDNPLAKELEKNLQPLTDFIVQKYIDFLPRLYYPIRVGEHTNTAFGLSFAWDYANTTKNTELKTLIESRARDFYINDKQCPLTWEPSGYDFLSPCFEEADLMRRVLSKDEFKIWLGKFLPQLSDKNFVLETAIVSDRTDGKLVHLDGLNFSRAWCMYGIANNFEEYKHLKKIANNHITYSLPNIVDDSYEGGHWLASFAIYALSQVQ